YRLDELVGDTAIVRLAHSGHGIDGGCTTADSEQVVCLASALPAPITVHREVAADQRCQDSAAAADPRDVLLQSCHRLGTTCGSRVAAIEEAVHRDARHAELGKRCDRSRTEERRGGKD